MADLTKYMTYSKKYNEDIIYECDPIDMITKGSKLYAHLVHQGRRIKITEVSMHSFVYIFPFFFSSCFAYF